MDKIMKPEYEKIKQSFDIIIKALFRIDATLTYTETILEIEKLCNLIIETETEESVWNIGEYDEACLSDLISGAFWFFTDYHGGEFSLEYRVFSRLGEIFKPNCSTLEEDCPEHEVYQMLEELVNKYKKNRKNENH